VSATAAICFSATASSSAAAGEGRRQPPLLRNLRSHARLQAGRNVLAALVLDMSRVAHRPTQLGAPCSVMTYAGGFVLEGEFGREDLSTDARWKVAVDTAHRFQTRTRRSKATTVIFEHRVSREMRAAGPTRFR